MPRLCGTIPTRWKIPVRRVLVVSLFNWVVIYGLFFWSIQRHDDLALPRLGWRALAKTPVALLAIAGTVAVQAFFSQTQVMNNFFSTAPLNLEQLLICALPMLLMVPMAWLGERLDPTRAR